jgi:hypothetical protein
MNKRAGKAEQRLAPIHVVRAGEVGRGGIEPRAQGDQRQRDQDRAPEKGRVDRQRADDPARRGGEEHDEPYSPRI